MTAVADASDLLVVDASVVVALVASQASATEAIAARIGDGALHAPTHLPVEVQSALRGLERGGVLTTPQASFALRHAAGLPVELWPWEVLADRAWELRSNLTTYDAGYVALAERLGCPLLTADRRVAAASVARCPVEVIAL
ncbi:type II toxin-antitoxin system VapC family toxin [Microbacterium telephonicum]|uniref:Ribonuclease VapC n=1 Tax=Microbacterium telephonicum TaxID=1714841 RepID=A0A498CMS9_9MICO|nr:type II toxin-antitoxin system VapC family toxin [Microbacterium telephonicum]RLK52968.1 putative nucleic acid-binding protein [Microbacterium telephonicum]